MWLPRHLVSYARYSTLSSPFSQSIRYLGSVSYVTTAVVSPPQPPVHHARARCLSIVTIVDHNHSIGALDLGLDRDVFPMIYILYSNVATTFFNFQGSMLARTPANLLLLCQAYALAAPASIAICRHKT